MKRWSKIHEQLHWWLGLVAAIAIALTGQAEVIPEPYRHWVSIVGIVGTAVNAYCIHPHGKDSTNEDPSQSV